MAEQLFEGVIEDISIKLKNDGGNYLKIKVNGKTFNFFDMKYYEEHKDLFQIGNNASVVYYESKWKGSDGIERTSNNATAIAIKKDKPDMSDWDNPRVRMTILEKSEKETQKQIQKQISDIQIYEKSLTDAIDLCRRIEEAKNIKFPPEVIKDVGTSLFIQRIRRMI